MTVVQYLRSHPRVLRALLVVMGAYVLLSILTGPEPPIQVLEVQLERTIIRQGEEPRVRFLVERRENCPGTADWQWLDGDGRVVLIAPPRPVLTTALGRNWSPTVSLPAPPGLGRRCWQSTARYQCGDDAHVVRSPLVCVEVIP